MTTVAIETLGCKLNQAESEALARELLAAGFQMVSPGDGADVYVVNTCTVTHVADRKARHLLRLARRRNPRSLIVAAGCYAERAPAEMERMEGVDLVVGADKTSVVGHLTSRTLGLAGVPLSLAIPLQGGEDRTPDCFVPMESGLAMAQEEGFRPSRTVFRTRSQVKVQDGCDAFCAYCIVPHVRGRERSIPPDRVVGEVKSRIDEGYREVVLTGTRVGSYRHNGTVLQGLVERILSETGVARLRLSSLQPRELTPGLLALWSNPRLCRHFHLALQSGSGETLKRMAREYSLQEYREAVARIRASVPGVAITTDVIVGFPGETDGEFEESYRFCEEMDFAGIHTFPYSVRSGTAAAEMPGQVAELVKRERKEMMLRLARESARGFREMFIGERAEVLWEGEDEGLLTGLTDNYIRVLAPARSPMVNEILLVRLVSQGEGHLLGSA
ncbi:MAG: threonylcarbamoyladenosine tRNA methylthiotransferase MtaB [Dehalococcoidia bacterium]|nr:threonylcarbamoyladenosine tRNA methylthiotransferase MtaB [Dehalococcoidia bacterium]